MVALIFVAGVVVWYVLRGLARWWPAARRTVDRLSPYTRRLHGWVLAAPASFAYIAVFTSSTLVQQSAPPRLISLLTRIQSTNLKHLSLDPVKAMADSAFWVADKGAGLSFYIALFACVVAWAEQRYGTPRIILIGLSGHVFGSLLTALVEWHAINSGRAPAALARTTDVGVSYIMVAGCVAAVILMRGWWRIAGVTALTIGIVVPIFVTHTLWNFGHLFATLCGLVTALISLKIAPARAPVDVTHCLTEAVAARTGPSADPDGSTGSSGADGLAGSTGSEVESAGAAVPVGEQAGQGGDGDLRRRA
jgi:hypothetical protein